MRQRLAAPPATRTRKSATISDSHASVGRPRRTRERVLHSRRPRSAGAVPTPAGIEAQSRHAELLHRSRQRVPNLVLHCPPLHGAGAHHPTAAGNDPRYRLLDARFERTRGPSMTVGAARRSERRLHSPSSVDRARSVPESRATQRPTGDQPCNSFLELRPTLQRIPEQFAFGVRTPRSTCASGPIAIPTWPGAASAGTRSLVLLCVDTRRADAPDDVKPEVASCRQACRAPISITG